MAQNVTHDTFQSEVLNKPGIVLVDFYADWCGPCKMVAPILDELAKEQPDVAFVKVDVDKENALSDQYSITSLPTFLIFKGGKVVSQFIGAQGKETFQQQISQAKAMA
jgi:thioredoxin 1